MFDFDQFRWQQENKIQIAEKFRADGLNRVLYKCPHCHAEGKMQGQGIYHAGEGKLRHSKTGFHLSGCDGKLDYQQSPGASYSINSDFFWYEIGDVICIGNSEIQYYCVPKTGGDVAAKTRLAVEELYKLTEQERKNVRKMKK